MGSIEDAEDAAVAAEDYAAEHCVGEFDGVEDARLEDGVWTVVFRTRTFDEEYTHRVSIADATGNAFSHERDS